ncbi:MAG: hypothetical protein ACRD04_05370 [Terriglobales bacterium]
MQPLLCAALALAAGIVAAAGSPSRFAPPEAAWAAVLMLAALAAAALGRGQRHIAASSGPLLCMALGYGRAAALRQHPPLPGPLARTALALQTQPRRRVFVTGYLRDRPQLLYDRGQPSAVRLDFAPLAREASAEGKPR